MSKRESGRFYPDLTLGERKFLEKEAEKHGVTPNIVLEAAVLHFFKKFDEKLYDEAKEHANPKALELVEKTLKK